MEFLSAFEVPAAAVPVMGTFITPEDVRFIEALASGTFTAEQARFALVGLTASPWPDERLRPFLRSAYARGVVELEDESFERFRLGTFYGLLEVFVVTEPESYLALPRETQVAIDRWCFETYLEGLADEPRPTSDRLVGLEATLAHIDAADAPIWLNLCDCRTLSGRCDKPVETCISFRNGINTLSHRGVLRQLTKDEAKGVVRRANDAGLMQTMSDNAICNCCSDCCYLFRAEAARGTHAGVWPRADSVVEVDTDRCIRCEACLSRCPFAALSFVDGDLVRNADLCRGCGLCVETCPTVALSMAPRAAVS